METNDYEKAIIIEDQKGNIKKNRQQTKLVENNDGKMLICKNCVVEWPWKDVINKKHDCGNNRMRKTTKTDI